MSPQGDRGFESLPLRQFFNVISPVSVSSESGLTCSSFSQILNCSLLGSNKSPLGTKRATKLQLPLRKFHSGQLYRVSLGFADNLAFCIESNEFLIKEKYLSTYISNDKTSVGWCCTFAEFPSLPRQARIRAISLLSALHWILISFGSFLCDFLFVIFSHKLVRCQGAHAV